jgi:hypothetical protein
MRALRSPNTRLGRLERAPDLSRGVTLDYVPSTGFETSMVPTLNS